MRREPNFGWVYPPGVTGNEPQIAGHAPERCFCGHSDEDHKDGDAECLECKCPEFKLDDTAWDEPDPDTEGPDWRDEW